MLMQFVRIDGFVCDFILLLYYLFWLYLYIFFYNSVSSSDESVSGTSEGEDAEPEMPPYHLLCLNKHCKFSTKRSKLYSHTRYFLIAANLIYSTENTWYFTNLKIPDSASFEMNRSFSCQKDCYIAHISLLNSLTSVSITT